MRNEGGVSMRELTMKELVLFTLAGDINECVRSGMTKKGVRGLLKGRYVRKGLNPDEFENALDESNLYD